MAETDLAPPASPPEGKGRTAVAVRRPSAATVWDTLIRWREASILLVGIALVLYFWYINSAFVSSDNIRTLAQSAAPWIIMATGEVLLLICGEIDLSVGNVYALAPFIVYFGWTDHHIPLVIGVILGVLVGALAGFVNGVVTVLLKVPSFITTLGMSFLLLGITLTISNDFPVQTPGSGTYAYILGHGDYSEIIWALGIVVVMQIVLSFTPWGLHTIATGGNILGAREVGINVNWVKIGNFVLTGMFAAFAGIIEAIRITSTDPSAGGTPIMFDAVVAAVIGGTSLMGGSGTIVGACIGGFVLAILNDGFSLQGISANTYYIILGAAILVAMVVNIRLQQLRRGR